MTFLIGFFAGLFGGLLGVGGGIIMIPLMVGLLKVSQHKAHGTSLVALVFTGITGAIAYGIRGAVDLRAAVLMALTAVITARAGARFASSLPEWKLKRSFGAFLMLVALLLLLKPYLPAVHLFASNGGRVLVLLLTGIFTGFLSGMMGVGGGVIMIPAMVLLAGFDQHLAQGTSLLTMVPAGAVGARTHAKLGNVEAKVLGGLIPGIMVGTYLGGNLAHLLSERSLRIVFACVLVWTGIRYIRTKRA